MLSDWLKKTRATFLTNQIPNVTWSYAFSRAWRWLHIFASSSNWFLVLFSSVLIGQSDYFELKFSTLQTNLVFEQSNNRQTNMTYMYSVWFLLTKALWSRSLVLFFSSNSIFTANMAVVTSVAAAAADSNAASSFLQRGSRYQWCQIEWFHPQTQKLEPPCTA